MSSKSAAVGLALAVATWTAAPHAAGAATRSGTLHLDPAATRITFVLPGSLHDTHGTFRLSRGIIAVDGASGAAGGVIVIDAASGASGNGLRDDRMKKIVLEVERYPDIRFIPARIDGRLGADGAFHAILHGTLALHGGEHALALDVDGRLDGDELSADARCAIPYVAWGLADPSVLFLEVAKEVRLAIHAAGRVTWEDA